MSKDLFNKGLGLEVTDVEAEVAEQEAKDSKGKRELAEGLNCGGRQREQSEDCSLDSRGLIY